jgi:hypothetical protein
MAPFDLSYWHAILGCLAFSEFLFCQKSDPTLVKSHFKNTMGNPFLSAIF